MQKSTVGYLFAGFALTAVALPAAASEWRDYRGVQSRRRGSLGFTVNSADGR